MLSPLVLSDSPKHHTTGFGGIIPLNGQNAGMIQAKHTNRYKFIQQIETEKENSLPIQQTKPIVWSPHPSDVGK